MVSNYALKPLPQPPPTPPQKKTKKHHFKTDLFRRRLSLRRRGGGLRLFRCGAVEGSPVEGTSGPIPMTDPWDDWYIYLHEWLIFMVFM